MKKCRKLLALLLVAALLAGCGRQLTGDMIRYEDMTYTRPNLARMEHMLSLAVDAAMAEEYGGKLRDVLGAIYAFYDEYDSFYTNYSLADIRSCHDLTDLYWQEEYAWCMEKSADVEALLEELTALVKELTCAREIFLIQAGCTISSHCGPKTLGVLFLRKA